MRNRVQTSSSETAKIKLKLFLPDVTQPRDLCLIPWVFVDIGMVLVARLQKGTTSNTDGDGFVAHDCCEIIAKGYISRRERRKSITTVSIDQLGEAECGEVPFDVEDLLVLYRSLIQWPGSANVGRRDLADFIRTRVCRYPGSSVAVRRDCDYAGCYGNDEYEDSSMFV